MHTSSPGMIPFLIIFILCTIMAAPWIVVWQKKKKESAAGTQSDKRQAAEMQPQTEPVCSDTEPTQAHPSVNETPVTPARMEANAMNAEIDSKAEAPSDDEPSKGCTMQHETFKIKSNNDYAKKLKKTATRLVVASIIVFAFLMAFFNRSRYTVLAVLDIAVFVVSFALLIFAIAIHNTTITVTDKRVYGVTMFSKRVDLPVDSISAVASSLFKGIAVGTSSGRIVFKGIGNRDAIYDAIIALLIERQCK